ncbi:MAG TPA: molybdopterin-binding protein [Kofleriaceae bacterium]|nr:molybdopterin-binding protein [Kofleriaceae bacterium]
MLSLARDDAGTHVIAALVAAGHRIVDRELAADSEAEIKPRLARWVRDDSVDVVIVTGGSDLGAVDPTLEVLGELATRRLPGFGELVRAISFQRLGVPALLNRAAAAVCGHAVVIVLPGSVELVEAVLEAVVIPQLDARTPGATFAALLARAPRPRDPHRTKPPPLPPRPPMLPSIVKPPAAKPPAIKVASAAVTTGSIATIGDLPSFTYDAASDLRRDRRPISVWLVMLAVVAMCASVAAAVIVVFHRSGHGETIASQPSRPQLQPSPQPEPSLQPSPPPSPPPHQQQPPSPQQQPPPAVRPHATQPQPQPEAPAQPPLADGCDQVSCVLSHYERECCAPYKPAAPPPRGSSDGPPEAIDRGMVLTALAEVKPLVSQCGDRAGVKGTVKIHVEVAPDGAVSDVTVREAPDEALGTCIAAAARKAHFAQTRVGGSFTYPYVF